MAVAPERGACWPAPLKPMAFLPGWRPGRKEGAHLPSPCPKAGCAGKRVGKQIYFVTDTISTAMKGLSGVVFTSKAREQPICHQGAGWKTRVGNRQRDEVAFLLLGKVIPMPGHQVQPLACTTHQAFSSELASLWQKAKITSF